MLSVKDLRKDYGAFKLDGISFSVPRGYITGFIGANGAGKTTTLKNVLNITHSDGGEVKVFGMDMAEHEQEIKRRIGFASGAFNYYTYSKVSKVASVVKSFYDEWSDEQYRKYIKAFNIDESKRIKDLSLGMRVKFSLALALSHNAELIILDEPTSGLDPLARDELLDVFREIISDGERSILFSTHITSDLDKCADYILFIKDGKVVANDEKDALLAAHVLVCGGPDALSDDIRDKAKGIKTNDFGFTALMLKADAPEGYEYQSVNLEDIMVYYNRGGERK